MCKTVIVGTNSNKTRGNCLTSPFRYFQVPVLSVTLSTVQTTNKLLYNQPGLIDKKFLMKKQGYKKSAKICNTYRSVPSQKKPFGFKLSMNTQY